MTAFDVIVLAGGEARRLGGVDKGAITVGDATLLERALGAARDANLTVVVGPPRERGAAAAGVLVTREEPAGTGPAAAIAHALGFVASPVVVVLAVDAPFASSAVERLLAALPAHDAAMLVDESGRRQPLLAAYVTEALRQRASERSWANRSVREMVDGLRVAEVAAVAAEALDCDTPEDVRRARDSG